jgi:cyclohexadienyl dehydratase
VIVNPGEPTSASTGSPQKATIVRWSDHGTIFDALVQGKADLMIIDTLETGVRAKLHTTVLCPVDPNAPFDPFGVRLLEATRSDFRGLRQSMAEPA